MKIKLFAFFLSMLMFFSCRSSFQKKEPIIPEWRGKLPGTDYFGSDRLWRLRDQVIFHLYDETGSGFNLTLTVRDMNVYCQGTRYFYVWVTAPDGSTAVSKILDDDGIISNDLKYKDGIADTFLDWRYREFHRTYSPGGNPPDKERSPFLDNPEKIPARQLTLKIRTGGKGLYRVFMAGSYDHWVSLTPDRPLYGAIHPGPGPLYLPIGQLSRTFLYAPEKTSDICIAISEETQPYNWQASLRSSDGKEAAALKAQNSYNYLIARSCAKGVYRLDLNGKTSGANLHLSGIPALFCPDEKTALLFQGAVLYYKGYPCYHQHQKTLLEWALSLSKNELDIDTGTLDPQLILTDNRNEKTGGPTQEIRMADIIRLLTRQQIDNQAADFLTFRASDDSSFEKKFDYFNPKVNLLAQIASFRNKQNPLYENPALIKRVAAYTIVHELSRLNTFFWYQYRNESPVTIKGEPTSAFAAGYRSYWRLMHDSKHGLTLRHLQPAAEKILPKEIMWAWKLNLKQHVLSHMLIQQQECVNQWAYMLAHLSDVYVALGRDRDIKKMLKFQTHYFLTPGNTGKVDPDVHPFNITHAGNYLLNCDSGMTAGGVPSDGLGHDNEYCLETVTEITKVYKTLPDKRILKWLEEYYQLKTHLTMPKGPVYTNDPFSETCSPSDFNFRTRYYTHKSTTPEAFTLNYSYGKLWDKKYSPGPDIWPCMEQKPFIRTLGERYHFINTSHYYAITYTGPGGTDYMSFSQTVKESNSFRLAGYNGMHYGGLGRKAAKPGGISALWVKDCGPTILAGNQHAAFSHTVWGRLKKPICETWVEGFVDPYIVSSGYSHQAADFDPVKKVLRKTEKDFFAPFQTERTITFHDDHLVVDLEITALENFQMKELYECIPYFAENRVITLFKNLSDKGMQFQIPEAVLAYGTHTKPEPERSGENRSLPILSLHAFDISSGGSGSLILLDKTYQVKQTMPLKYRDIASPCGAFNLILPVTMKKGEKNKVRYIIFTHLPPHDTLDLTELAKSFFNRSFHYVQSTGNIRFHKNWPTSRKKNCNCLIWK